MGKKKQIIIDILIIAACILAIIIRVSINSEKDSGQYNLSPVNAAECSESADI